MKLLQNKDKCCGCGICADLCTQSAISMQADIQGFLYPVINEEKCIECGLCLKKCVFQNGYDGRKDFTPSFGYAARHKDPDVLMNSRSGGAFTALSDNILKQNGIICGAGYAEDTGYHKVIHKIADTPEKRDELRGSKYVQSDLGTILPEIKADCRKAQKCYFVVQAVR